MLARFTGSTSIILDSRSLAPSDSGTCSGNANCPAQHPSTKCLSHAGPSFQPTATPGAVLSCMPNLSPHASLTQPGICMSRIFLCGAFCTLRCGKCIKPEFERDPVPIMLCCAVLCFEACLRTPHMPSVDSLYDHVTIVQVYYYYYYIPYIHAGRALRCGVFHSPLL